MNQSKPDKYGTAPETSSAPAPGPGTAPANGRSAARHTLASGRASFPDHADAPDLGRALLDASRRMSTQTVFFHQAVAKSLGLHITDHKCLDLVIGMGRATAGQLAEMTGLTTGAITSVINRLERSGFVRRAKDPRDLRIVYVEPLLDRLQPLQEIFAPLGEAMADLHSRYSDEELRLILDYLERSAQVLARQAERLKSRSR